MTPGWIVPVVICDPDGTLAIGVEKANSVTGTSRRRKSLSIWPMCEL